MRPAAQYPESAQPLGAQSVGVGRGQRRIAATGQLSSADADTRLAGALALIELADEWLTAPAAADSLTADQPAREAQAIIHELCAYIRSPFPAGSTSSRTELAQYHMRLLSDVPESLSRTQREQFQAEKSALTAEALVRGCILEAIHDRFVQESDYGTPPCTGGTPDLQEAEGNRWSGLDYDFSGAVFFYPVLLKASYCMGEMAFRDCIFLEEACFSHAYFAQCTDFSGAAYYGDASFGFSSFKGGARFDRCTFGALAEFTDTYYGGDASFRECTYKGLALYDESTYCGTVADFSNSVYCAGAEFGGAGYDCPAIFSGSVFEGAAYFRFGRYADTVRHDGCSYAAAADFSYSVCWADADFSGSAFAQGTSFTGCEYYGAAHFSGCSFTGGTVNYSGSIYAAEVSFSSSMYGESTGSVMFDASGFFDGVLFTNVGWGNASVSFTGCVFNPSSRNVFTNWGAAQSPVRFSGKLPLGARALAFDELDELQEHRQALHPTAFVAPASPGPAAEYAHLPHRVSEEAVEEFARWARELIGED